MPTVTNFSDVVTQGNTTATGNLTVQGTGTSSFTSALSAVTMAGTLAVTGITTHSSNIVPSSDFVCGIGTAGARFGNIYSANTNIYTIANIFTANIWSANVTNIATFQNSVYHFQNTFATGFTQTTGIIIPTSTGISGLGGPSLLFANAFLQTANIGSSTAQLSMNITGNVLVSNSVNVANLQCVTANASYMNIITGGYANMASINVFTGANATFLTVQTLANVYGTANIVTSNIQTANIVFANVQNLNVSTGANVSYLNVTYIANVNTANILTSNIQSANVVLANVQSLNVSTGANTTYLAVQFVANVFSANLITSNIQTANIVFANVQNLNVSTGANVSYLNVTYIANVNTANILTSNIQSANIVTANVQNLNVSTGANVSYLNVTFIANVNTANILTSNIQSANIVTANVQNLNVSTGANVSYLNVTFVANVNTANILTSNIQSANIVFANVQNLNVSTGANVSYLNVSFIANVNTANILTANIASANIVTANVSNLNTYSANITSLFVQTFANILSSNIVSAFHSTMNVSSVANVFTANIYNGNVQTTFNVSGLLSATLHSGNASALSNINASNVTMGILPFRNDGAIGLGATAISINGSVGVNNQYLSSTGTSLQWVGPPAAIFSQVPTSTNQIFYNSGNVAMGIYNWTQFGVGYNTYPGVPLDVYGGSGSFSNVSDANQTGTIRIMQNAANWAANGGLEFKTGTNIAGAGHRIVTTEIVSSSGIAPLIFQYRANSPVWSNAMVIHNGTTTPGFVGIGTMAPLFNLHIYQVSNTSPAVVTVQMSNTGQSSQLYLSNASGTTTQLYLNGPNLSSDGPANSATLRNNAGDLRLAALGTNPYIYLQTSTSRVGISTSTPTQTLDVQGYARVGSSGSDTARLILGRAPGATNFDYASMIESVSTFASNYSSTLKFYTHENGTTAADPTLAMTINPTQQVGIGVAPGYKFHVDNGAVSGIACVHQASTIVAGNTTSMILGKALSTNNSATIVWNHVGEGLATNYLGLGYFGGDNKLCVTSSGTVGVGITAPGALFQVNASAINPTIPTVHIGDNANDYGATYGMVHLTRNATPGDTKAHLSIIRNGNTGVNFGFYNNTNTFGIWAGLGITTATPTIVITTGSLVGIGTTAPATNLDVAKTTASGTPAIEIRGAGGGPRLQVYGRNADAQAWMGLGTDMAGGSYEHSIYFPNANTGANGFLTFGSYNGTAYSEKMRITVGGNVGIGNASPATKLHVSNGDSSTATFGPNATWGSSLRVGAGNQYNSGTSGLASVITTNGNLHIDSGTGQNLYLQYFTAGAGVGAQTNSYGPWTHTGNMTVTGSLTAGTGTIITANEIAMQYYNTAGAGSKYVGVSGTGYCLGGMEIESTTLNGSWSQKVHFRTHYYGVSNGRRVTINETGYLGVGTETPNGRLHIYEASGTAAGTTTGSLIIDHGNNYGSSSIVFPSRINYGSDYGYIQYNDTRGGAGETANMIIGTSNDGDDHISLMPSGNVGINTLTPGYKLEVQGTIYSSSDITGGTEIYVTNWFRVNGGGGIYWSAHGGGWNMTDTTYIRTYGGKYIYCDNTITCAGDIIAYYSDMRLKHKIEPITGALDKIKTLSTFTYEVNDLGASFGLETGVRNTGFSAQEVQAIMPEVIRLAPFDMGEKSELTGYPESKSGENYMTLLYDKMAPLIVAALKEEVQKREDLEKEVAELKQLVQNLLARQ